MCGRGNHYYAHHKGAHSKEDYMRYRFYKNLNTFIFFNAFVLLVNIGDGGVGVWKWIALFWGLSLLSQYKKIQRQFNPNWDKPKSKMEDEIVDDIGPDDKPKDWKDKDLV